NGTTGAIIAGGHISPSHTGLFDLGRNGLGWNNIYASSTIYTGAGGTSLSTLTPNILAFAGSIGVVSSTAGNLRLAADGTNQLQLWTNNNQRMLIDSSGNTFASGTLQTTGSILSYGNVTSTGHIYPASNAAVDLGAYGSAFRDVFASGTYYGQNFRLASLSGKNYTANSSLATSSPYLLNATSGAGSVSGSATGRDFLFNNSQDRIRQNGTITRIRLYIAGSLASTTNVTLRIWRFNGSTYDQVGTSGNILSSLTGGQFNTVTLSPGISVMEGDYVGIQITSTAGTQLVLSGSGDGHGWKYTDGMVGNNFNWDGSAAANNGSTVAIETYMTSPQMIFIGDSIMAGHTAHYSFAEATATTYNSQSTTIGGYVSSTLGYTYQNMGIGSETTTNIVARFTTDVVNLSPKIVVIEGGVNDIAGGAITKATFLSNWTTMLNSCQSNNITCIITLILPWTNGTNGQMITRDDWNSALRKLANSYSNAVVVDADPYVGQYRATGPVGNLWDIKTAYNADNVHFNSAGHQQIAKAIVDQFKQSSFFVDNITTNASSSL
ncbi:MAG: GDSL-type esterase/lipase family protein, partial [Patescibacteria group bacterium]